MENKKTSKKQTGTRTATRVAVQDRETTAEYLARFGRFLAAVNGRYVSANKQ